MKRKKITLSGIGTVNKGAELMLYAILQEIERKFPDAIVYIEANKIPQGLDYIKTNLELRYKPIVKWQSWFKRFHIYRIAKIFHINKVHLDDVYAVSGTKLFIDASGFFISDQWHHHKYRIIKWSLLLKRNKAAGAKLVFLPQAFGPIEREDTKGMLSCLDKYADIVMPREKTSFDYLLSSGLINMDKVKLHTDFTSLVKGVFPAGHEHLKGAVCIIPNVKMTTHGKNTIPEYVHFMSTIIENVKELRDKVYILNHEGKDDEDLAFQIQKEVNGEIEVVTGLNALEVKGLISSAYLVIASRFHGVASTLNSCVPCLATSWSHKYAELFRDFGQEDCVLPLDNIDMAQQKVKDFMSEEKNAEIRKALQKVSPKIQADTRRMWEEVWKL